MPMINEAIFAVMEGVGTPEAIDTVMKLGMNHPMGPLTLADFIGLDVCLAILDVLHDGLGDPKYRAVPAAAADGRGRPARPEVRPGLLRVPSHSRPRRSARGSRSRARRAVAFCHDRCSAENGLRRSVVRGRCSTREMNQSSAERPEHLDAVRRIGVGRQPVEQQMRGVRGRADQRDASSRTRPVTRPLSRPQRQ